ncbi:MAG: tripartite tricarboxylate transporter substrate binding protein [Burkholderiales bacterium]|nr:tripartite tricarboxylate transporter substrate binding protein [Burkholderiales bacterium]
MVIATTSCRALAALALGCAAACVQAQGYPTRAVRVLVGTAAGGPQDIIARGSAQVLQQALGQAFVVENRPGADSIIGMEACARAAPDGHTLCTADNWAVALNPLTRLKLPYDPARDFAPIVHYGFLTVAVLARPSLPQNSMREVFEFLKANPGRISWGSYGASSATQLYMAYYKNARGIQFLNVPYKSASLTFPAMLGGEIDMAYLAIGLAAQSVKSGKAKALAVVGPSERSPMLPEVPTWQEAGMEFNIATWFGLFAPAAVPREVVSRVHATLAKGLFEDAQARAKFLTGIGMAIEPPAGGTPQALGALVGAEREKLARLVKIVGLKPE